MPWAVAGGALAAAGAIGSSVLSSNAAQSAANTQAAADNQASTTENSQYQQTAASLAPWVQGGQGAFSQLQNWLGLTGPQAPGTSALTNSFNYQGPTPGAQWGLQQGLQAGTNAASTSGLGGNALTALANYGQNAGMSDYWNQYNAYTGRQSQLFNMLNTVSSGGQSAANQTGAFGQATGAQVGAGNALAGNALAAGTIGSANATNAGIGNSLSYLTNPAILSLMQGGGGGVNSSANYQNAGSAYF